MFFGQLKKCQNERSLFLRMSARENQSQFHNTAFLLFDIQFLIDFGTLTFRDKYTFFGTSL